MKYTVICTQSNSLPRNTKVPVLPGSALVVTLITMGILLAYSVHALHSSSALYHFAHSRALRIHQEQYLALVYDYAKAFCTQHHKQLCQSKDTVHVALAPDNEQHNYILHLVIVPTDTHYMLTATISRGPTPVASGEKIVFYDSISC